MNKTIYTSDHRILVQKLRQARIESGFDQKYAAKLLNKSQSYISKIESGQRKIEIFQLKSFAEIYKKNIEYFLK